MTDVLESFSPVDFPRVEFCPQCDYSLKGLPAKGTCPECGRGYDSEFIILRGTPSMNHETGAFSRVAVLANFASSISIAIFLLIVHPPVFHNPFILTAGFCWLFWIGFTAVGAFTSPQAGRSAVWISPVGIGQQSVFDPGSMQGIISRWAGYLSPLVVVMPMMTFSHIDLILCAVMAVFGVGLHFFVQRVGRTPSIRLAEGIQPALHGWGIFDRINLKPLGKNRYRLLARHSSWVKRAYVINIVVEASDTDADALRSLITRWSHRTV
jgi:hypothetical protein